MSDQVAKIKHKSISAAQIIADKVQKNPNLYTEVRDGKYQLVYASPEIVFAESVPFAHIVLQSKNCAFLSKLVCIAVDETHVVWAWQGF